MQHVRRIQVEEKVSFIEAGAAWLGQEIEMPNRYSIIDSATRRPIFSAEERTNFFMRQLKQCFGDCAPWELDIAYTGSGGSQPAFSVERPPSCTCLCLNRPTADVLDAAGGGSLLGSISDPCTCFSTVFHVRDAQGQEVYAVDGGCCQPGLWFPCPLGPCARVNFAIQDRRSGQEVGHIQKQLPGLLTWCFAPDVDHYVVDFASVRDPAHKALLMALAIYMDFRYWNDSSRDEKGGGLPFLRTEETYQY